ncbi:MAG: amidohydrolase family protein [Rhizobiaceae bacterium]|nr:amidohydrolase family protein [Rhizobiaceae bacterium]
MIDSHHHLWNPARGDYGWMPEDNDTLTRHYRLQDLISVTKQNGVSQTILVQAAPTVNETEYMMGIADSTDLIGGVVGWINFEDQLDRQQLERLANHPKFKSVRPMVQDIEDDNWLLREDIKWAFDAVVDLDLCFDALGFPKHSAPFLQVFQRHPELKVVIDHCMKPQIATDGFDDWAGDIQELASKTNACIKLSGLVTEAGAKASQQSLQPYVDHVIACFGADRIMWGSDWPVSRLSMEYGDWLSLAKSLTKNLSEADNNAIFSETANHFYRLS